MSKPIYELVDELPEHNMTVRVLNALDFVVPGEWENIVGFKETIRHVTGEEDEDLIQQIGDRAVWLYNDKSQGYQRAMWLYQTVDNVDSALGTAALANKVGEKIKLFGFLNRLTPKPDKAQSIDLALKLVVELLAFCQINGIPGDSIGDFVASLSDYSGESLMRMSALICLDALIPLGPDFVEKVQSTIERINASEIQGHPVYSRLEGVIPGEDAENKLGFIGESFNSATGWMQGFVEERDLSRDRILNNIGGFIEGADDKLDYVAAFLDMSTNYYEHTGTQTLAKRLIDRAFAEI
ncbi:hypothetical protein PN462_01235 [Spirulina sp. CS-785/01]|uniref:hypothetical protein n=1 Tax=Spirulina sp. CS-785/01 TaxID=3021716 RepID=UPI00232DFBCD|nr:hypothetical protein [Spirulina sp. CS-785/01]MDB9311706.1 hypothetical protein [Spirulina sp. CS-785/01]